MEMTLRPRRLKYFLFLLVSAAFACIGVLMVRGGDRVGWAEIALFGSGAVVFCILLLPGSAYLKLDPEGFTFCSLFRSHRLQWSEVNSFGVADIGVRKMVAFNFSPLHRGQERMRKVSAAIAGYEGALPDTYGRSAEDLAALMNQWRSRAVGAQTG